MYTPTHTVTLKNLYDPIPEDVTKIIVAELEDLEELPEGIFNKCTLLEILRCGANQLTSLPSLDKCTLLKEIWCINNQLTSLPSLDKCTLLEGLSCGYNHLTSLPSIDKCTLLEKLSCGDNQLTLLPSLDKCALLSILSCGNNQLTSLPSLDKCTLLEEIWCRNNQLTSLPSLDKCTLLERVWCRNNQLTSLPSLYKCTLLEVLWCSSNNLTSLPFLPSTLKYINYNNNSFSKVYTLSQLFLFQRVLTVVRCLQFIRKLRYRHGGRSKSVKRLVFIDSLVWRPPHLKSTTGASSVDTPSVDVGGIFFQESLEETLLLLQD